MGRTAFFSLVVVAVAHVLAATQVPLASYPKRSQDEHCSIATALSDEDRAEWSLDHVPNPNDTDHLVFETVHSLLQHWPNTRMRNGHSIVPGVVPQGTLLYHGRPDNATPTGPEWLATDPEHSYLFTRDIIGTGGAGPDRSKGGWHLTFMATRPLRVIYFDGSSAVKLPFGSMDTQDLFTSGKPSTGKDVVREETRRVRDLCDWGRNLGTDGFMRMQMDFEVVLCDFTSGVRLVSFDHVASKGVGPDGLNIPSVESFEVMNAGSWHNRFPGETRIQLDLSSMISFYDTELAPSLVPIRAGKERWDHRAMNVSSEHLAAAKARLEANVMRPAGASSGIDWKTLVQVIVDRYAQRLELTQYLVRSPASSADDVLDLAKKAQAQLRIMLTPYILFSAVPTPGSDETALDWTVPVYKRCATAHTVSMASLTESMTGSEKTLLRAVRGTSREICRVVTKMWASGVNAGIDGSLNTKDFPNVTEVTRLRGVWAQDLDSLMGWLDWSVWVKCQPGCRVEETCYLPTWPVGFPWLAVEPPVCRMPVGDEDDVAHRGWARLMAMKDLADDMQSAVKPGPDEWVRPQPKCIRRIKPYTF